MSHHSTFVTLFSSLYSLILHFLSIPTMANVNQWVKGRRSAQTLPLKSQKMGFKLNWSLDESLEQGWNNFGWVKKTSELLKSKTPEIILFGKMHAIFDKSSFTEKIRKKFMVPCYQLFPCPEFNLTPFGCFMTFWKYTRQVLDQYHMIPILLAVRYRYMMHGSIYVNL